MLISKRSVYSSLICVLFCLMIGPRMANAAEPLIPLDISGLHISLNTPAEDVVKDLGQAHIRFEEKRGSLSIPSLGVDIGFNGGIVRYVTISPPYKDKYMNVKLGDPSKRVVEVFGPPGNDPMPQVPGEINYFDKKTKIFTYFYLTSQDDNSTVNSITVTLDPHV